MVIAWHRLSTTGKDAWDQLDDDQLLEHYEEVVASGAILSSAKRGFATEIEGLDMMAGDHHNIYLKMGTLFRTTDKMYFPEDVGNKGDIAAVCAEQFKTPLGKQYCFDEWRRVYAFGFDLEELLNLGAFVGPDIIEEYMLILMNEPWYGEEWPEKLPKRLADKIKRVQKKYRIYGKKALRRMKSLAVACRKEQAGQVVERKAGMYDDFCFELFQQNEVGVLGELPLNLARYVIAAGILYKRPY